jgi:hypothetical protein
VQVSESGEGWCRFSGSKEPETFLKVEVSKSILHTCGADSAKLKGIGNEARRCRPSESSDPETEMISGRVRDLYFAILLKLHEKRNPANPPAAQDNALEQVAEQVAGNLF